MTKRHLDAEREYVKDLRAGKRMFGTSHQSASAALGKKDENGAGGSFDWNSKMWYASNETTWLKMYQTGMWHPVDTRVNAYDVALLIQERKESVQKSIDEASKKLKPSDTQVEAYIRKELCVPDDDPIGVRDLCAEHGVDASVVDASGKWGVLGPRSGISNLDRIKRGLRLGVLTVEELRSATPRDHL
jgi:hypothetical protein